MSLCVIHTNPKACTFYLIPHMMTFVAWKQNYSRISVQLDFSGSEIMCIFRVLKFVYIRCQLIFDTIH